MNKLIITLLTATMLIAAGTVFAEESYDGPGHKENAISVACKVILFSIK